MRCVINSAAKDLNRVWPVVHSVSPPTTCFLEFQSRFHKGFEITGLRSSQVGWVEKGFFFVGLVGWFLLSICFSGANFSSQENSDK